MSVNDLFLQNVFQSKVLIDEVVVVDENAMHRMHIDEETKMFCGSVHILERKTNLVASDFIKTSEADFP